MRNFELKINPRMLELLSRDLYTNIYSVFAELIANAYDADADNVYLTMTKDEIRIEDDGEGMSFTDINDIFLDVGRESRYDSITGITKKSRLRMGRKGIGKLSALAISDGFYIYSQKNQEKTGLFFPKYINASGDEKLPEIEHNKIFFHHVVRNGTAIVMKNPVVKLPASFDTLYKNIALMFPFTGKDFKIYIQYKDKLKIIKNVEKIAMKKLSTLITIGNDFIDYRKFAPTVKTKYYSHKSLVCKELEMITMTGERKKFTLEIKGWMGTMKSTRETKKEMEEFSDNYIAIYSHNKMGSRNILQLVGKNRVYDSYITSHLYIDLFENSELRDMASTNRQEYNEGDLRWIESKILIRALTDEIVKIHGKMANEAKKQKEKQKILDLKDREETLRKSVVLFHSKILKGVQKNYKSGMSKEDVVKLVDENVNISKNLIGLKSKVDSSKKKILISQTLVDKNVADIILNLLIYNGIPAREIIHSNSDNVLCNLPENKIYDYLKSFYVDSVSDTKIYIFFITSKNVYNTSPPEKFAAKWGCLMEMGAAWVSRSDYSIINIIDFIPQLPLNIQDKWVDINYNQHTKISSLSEAAINSLCVKVIGACKTIGYESKSFKENKEFLKTLVDVYTP